MSMVKEAQDPFMNKRSTVPSVFLDKLTEKERHSFNMAKGLISGGALANKVPMHVPASTLNDPFNQLNSPQSLRSKHIKQAFVPWSPRVGGDVQQTERSLSTSLYGPKQASNIDLYNIMA